MSKPLGFVSKLALGLPHLGHWLGLGLKLGSRLWPLDAKLSFTEFNSLVMASRPWVVHISSTISMASLVALDTLW